MIKKLLSICALCLMVALPANAKIFSWGPRVGLNISSMKFDKTVIDPDNRAGFTAGLQAEVMIPITNIGFDISAMYVHRTSNVDDVVNGATVADELSGGDNVISRDYIEIPLNLKWKISLPIVGNIVSPYVFTGPSVAFLTSKQAISEAYKNKAVDVAWNFGVGLQLVSHLQIGASYGLGLTNTIQKVGLGDNFTKIDSKTNCWTVTAAWLF